MDAKLPLKYSDLVNAATACPVSSKQCPKQLLKESWAIHLGSQLVGDWQIAYVGHLFVSESSKYALVCVDSFWFNLSFTLSLCKPGGHHEEIKEAEYHV